MDTFDASRIERYRDVLSLDELNKITELSRTPPPVAVRLNPLKIDPADAIKPLSHQYAWEVERVPFCPAGWLLKRFETSPGDTLEFRNGHYYIQDASSMLPVEAFDFKSGNSDLILDMAAAPGGKTTHLAARSGDAGLIIANDSSQRRIRALSGNLRTWGATSAVVTHFPGERLGSLLPDFFDKVLLDAPCSGESLRSSGGSKGRQISEREREALQSQQIRLLLAGIDALRIGGELIYATCTVAPEENEAAIQAALIERAGQIELAKIDLLDRAGMRHSGLTHFGGFNFHPSMASTERLWPFQFNTGAFFTARLLKIDGGGEIQRMDLGASAPKLLDKRAMDNIQDQLTAFGFDLHAECQRSGLVLIEQERFVHAVSGLWLERLPDLPVVGAGLPVGRWQGETFLPAHEWVTRYDSDFCDRRFTLDAAQTQRWLRGADLRDWAPPVKRGAVLLQDVSGRFLGVGSISAQRVRNLLPRSWVAG